MRFFKGQTSFVSGFIIQINEILNILQNGVSFSPVSIVYESQKRFTLKLMFFFLTDCLVFKNKTCACSISNVKFVETSKPVPGPFETQPNLVSTVTGSLFMSVFVFPVTIDQ